jgi:hypothetical protein
VKEDILIFVGSFSTSGGKMRKVNLPGFLVNVILFSFLQESEAFIISSSLPFSRHTMSLPYRELTKKAERHLPEAQRVLVLNAQGQSLKPPADLFADVKEDRVTLEWSPVRDADSYSLELSKREDFSDELHKITTTATRWTGTARDLSPGLYFARVKAKKGREESPWSVREAFVFPLSYKEEIKKELKANFGIDVAEEGGLISPYELLSLLHFLRVLPLDRFRGTITKIQIHPHASHPWAPWTGATASSDGTITFYGGFSFYFFAHELGHLVHFGRVKGVNIDIKKFEQLHAQSKPSDFVSAYAKTNWREDFAEIFRAYLTEPVALIRFANYSSELFREKLRIVIEVFREGNMFYTYKMYGVGRLLLFKVEKVPMDRNGLPSIK